MLVGRLHFLEPSLIGPIFVLKQKRAKYIGGGQDREGTNTQGKKVWMNLGEIAVGTGLGKSEVWGSAQGP